MKLILMTVTLIGLIAAAGVWWLPAAGKSTVLGFNDGGGRSEFGKRSDENFASVLREDVNEQNLVDYEHLKKNRSQLDAFASSLETLDPARYERWSNPEQIAFWINAYNALTLEAILEHYPIQSSPIRSLVIPKKSILQIPGVWNKIQFRIMGRNMTLNQIEHDTLRAKFNEPRIHFALVCASIGCPPLRREPYTGDRLENQLEDQARLFLSNPDKFRIDRKSRIVHLSSIFKWFGGDFTKKFSIEGKFPGHNPEQQAVLNFIARHVSEKDGRYLQEREYKIDYVSYDWSLNEVEQ